MNNNIIITIGRQFGSGGREIGKKISEKLNIGYYDRALIETASKATGLSESFFEREDEKMPSMLISSFTLNWFSNSGDNCVSPEQIHAVQSKTIREIAEKESCVIVGRCADYVLRDFPNCINIFVSSSMQARIARIMDRGDVANEKDAKNIAEKKDKLRANYYNFYSEKEWGMAKSYDLCINSSDADIDRIVQLIIDYVRVRTNSK